MHRTLKAVIGYCSATYLTLVLVLVGYGIASPRDGDREELQRAGLDGVAVLVGLRSVSTQARDGLHIEATRFYAVLPRSLTRTTLWTVSRSNPGTAELGASAGAFWIVLTLLLSSIAGTLWFWWFDTGVRTGQDAVRAAELPLA